MLRKLRITTVGDACSGKTTFLWSFARPGVIPEDSQTFFDTLYATWQVNGEDVALELRDTAPCEDMENIRSLSYPNTDVLLVFVSVMDPTGLFNVRYKWMPEIERYFKRPRMILVGTKTDLREDGPTLLRLSREGQQGIQPAQGEAMAETIRAIAYMECSKTEQDRMNDVFDLAVRTAMTPEAMGTRVSRWVWNHRQLIRRRRQAARRRREAAAR
jgi:small GTP-binding protein